MTDLPAGPELDRLVSEKVMGYTMGKQFRMDCTGHGWERPDFLATMREDISWRPSTNIAHAWEVVEKLQKQWDVTICWDRACAPQVCLHSGTDVPYDPNVVAQTVPLAICRAALAAVGEK